MAPTPEEISVALQAMRSDASVWEDMSDELAAARRIVDRLDLGIQQFSFLGDLAGLPDLYTEIQLRIAGLLQQGSDEFDHLGTALRRAADGYEDDDRTSAHEIRGVY